jgi:hypothetical protein
MFLALGVTIENALTISTSVLGFLLAVSALVGVIYGARYKVNYESAHALAETRGEALDDERERVKQLEQRIVEMSAEGDGLRATIARLESLPDLSRLVQILDQHEQRALERHEALGRLIETLVTRIETSGATLARIAQQFVPSQPERG